MNVIGLGHYSRTGKDSLANYFLAELAILTRDMVAKKMPFAWKLKQIAYELYAWDGLKEPEFYETAAGATYRDIPLPTIGKSPVQIWIDLGTPAVRDQVYDRTWIDYVLKSDHQADVLLIPDVRFENEIDAVRSMGGITIKVVRPGYGPRKSKADRALLGYTGWDYVIGRSGEMSELQSWAYAFARWQVGQGPKPYQAEDEKKAAMLVEKVEAWGPGDIERFDVEIQHRKLLQNGTGVSEMNITTEPDINGFYMQEGLLMHTVIPRPASLITRAIIGKAMPKQDVQVNPFRYTNPADVPHITQTL